MKVTEAIAAAEKLLPGQQAPPGDRDPRWQAIIRVGDFIESEPDAVWTFVCKWGCSDDEDLRLAVATVLLEHLLEYHFDRYMADVETLAESNGNFGHTVSSCWKLGQATEPARAARFDRLLASLKIGSHLA